jgi:zinc/manganese transport system substrate-binding protein
MRNQRFQLSVMNDTEPSARDIAAMEDDLRSGKVKAFIYNGQVADPQTERLLGIARASGVPVVGVTETLPAGKSVQQWMLEQVDELSRALGTPAS